MKTVFGLAFVMLLSQGSLVYAQGYAPNPYMPAGSGTNTQRQQAVQDAISALSAGSGGGYPGIYPAPQENAGDPAVSPEAPPPQADTSLDQLRAGQAQEINELGRERTDREFEINALRNVLEGEIHDLQKKVEDQQREIDALKYPANRQ